jgi:hypothetical protein
MKCVKILNLESGSYVRETAVGSVIDICGHDNESFGSIRPVLLVR